MICLQRVTGIAHFCRFFRPADFCFQGRAYCPTSIRSFLDKSPGGRGTRKAISHRKHDFFISHRNHRKHRNYFFWTRMARIVRMEDIASAISFLWFPWFLCDLYSCHLRLTSSVLPFSHASRCVWSCQGRNWLSPSSFAPRNSLSRCLAFRSVWRRFDFQRGFGLGGLQVGHHDVWQDFTEVLYLGLLNLLVGFLMEFE